MVTLYVKSEGQDAVMNIIADMAARGVNTRPLMGRTGHIILGSVARNFESEGRPGRWKPISQFTREIYEGKLLDRLRATKGYKNIKREATKQRRESSFLEKKSGKTLQRQGDLKKSVVVGKITNASVEIGSSLPYARIHQLGGEIRPKNKKALLIPLGGGQFLKVKKVTIPARPYLVLQAEDGLTIMRATKDYILEAANHAKARGNKYWR